MEKKKNASADVDEMKKFFGLPIFNIFFITGLLLVSGLLLAAVELDSFQTKDLAAIQKKMIEEEIVQDEQEQEEEEEIEEPVQQKPEEIEIPPPPSDEAEKVENDVVLTDPVKIDKPVIIPVKTKPKKTEPFRVVEQNPEFPGGFGALSKFIANAVVYPEISQELGDQGKVYVEFVVKEDGSIGKCKVVRGVSDELDKEAVRVVKSMPKWKPGKQRGKAVPCYYTIPINFQLQ